MAIPQTPSPLNAVLASNTYNAAWFSGTTKEAQITAAIAAAVKDGAKVVYIPLSMTPYNPSLVTFNSAIRMSVEGGPIDANIFNLEAYGATGDGNADDTAAAQAWANALTSQGLGLNGIGYVPPGRFKITSTVNFDTALAGSIFGPFSIVGQGRTASTFVDATPIGSEMFKIGTSTATLDYFHMKDFTVELARTKGYQRGSLHLVFVREFAIDNLAITGGSNTSLFGGFLLDLDASYNGNVSNCSAFGRKVYLYDLNVDSRPAEQSDSINMRNLLTVGVYCGFTRIGASSATPNSHGIYVEHAKLVPPNAIPENSVDINTTITTSPGVGGTSFTLASAANIAQGDLILLDVGNIAEPVEISVLNGAVVTTTTPLRYAHTNGAQVLKGCVGHVLGQGLYNVMFTEPHFEATACGFHVASTVELSVIMPHSGAKDLIRIVESATPACTDGFVVGGAYFGNNGANNILHVTTAGDSGTFSRWRLMGPFRQLPAAVAGLVAYVNDAGTIRQVHIENDDSTAQGQGFMMSYASWPAGVPAGVYFQSLKVNNVLAHALDAIGQGSAYHGRTQERYQAFAPVNAGTVTPDATIPFNRIVIGAGVASWTLANPINTPAAQGANNYSQFLHVFMVNTSGGAMPIPTLGNAYKTNTAIPAIGNNLSREFVFHWDVNSSLWIEVSRSPADF